MLWKLVSSSRDREFDHEVISLTGDGPIGERLRSIGVSVYLLQLSADLSLPFQLFKLSRLLGDRRPDLVQTWMYHADLFGGVASKLSRSVPIVWNVRASRLDAAGVGKRTMLVIRACSRLSRLIPSKIVCCSNASREVHVELGYDATKMITIPNGFDLSQFKPDQGARRSVRAELGVRDDALLIGLVARFDPLKGHRLFVEASARLHLTHPQARFVLCGAGVTSENDELSSWIEVAGTGGVFHLLGYRPDVARLQASLDISTCCSSTEGFPNVVGEAMACGVPCVVTDVGDSAFIVGDTGEVVPSGDSDALAAAWARMIDAGHEKRRDLGLRARQRIEDQFELAGVVNRYLTLYRSLSS